MTRSRKQTKPGRPANVRYLEAFTAGGEVLRPEGWFYHPVDAPDELVGWFTFRADAVFHAEACGFEVAA